MTNKEKILAEIERRRKQLRIACGDSAFYHREKREMVVEYEALDRLLSFINSLPEEPVKSIWHDASEKPNGKDYVIAWDGKYASIAHYKDVVNCKWCYLKDILDKSKEPVSEGLEEAVNAYIGYAPEVDECSSVYGKRQAFKAGAQWQKEQGVTKEAIIGMATEEISINISQPTLDMLDLCAGDKVIIQIRRED